jgi:hypothetical protein
MYAAKRKLHNLLESVTGPASESKNSETNTLAQSHKDFQAKRRKVLNPHLLGSFKHRNSPSTAVARQPVTTVDQKSSPGFAPWDRGQFLARLESFRHVDKWSAKPSAIDEVHWAKRGWSCSGPERVRCVRGCEKELVVRVEDEEASEEGPEDQATLSQEGSSS